MKVLDMIADGDASRGASGKTRKLSQVWNDAGPEDVDDK
jgi:hypothetical protein